jgi:hypothetical protein
MLPALYEINVIKNHLFYKVADQYTLDYMKLVRTVITLTHWHTQPAVRLAEPSMPLLLILALFQ